MQTFISEVVDALILDDQNLSDLMIIVPSKRAGGVFRNTLSRKLKEEKYQLIDCQLHTDHLESLGAYEISRKAFLKYLK